MERIGMRTKHASMHADNAYSGLTRYPMSPSGETRVRMVLLTRLDGVIENGTSLDWNTRKAEKGVDSQIRGGKITAEVADVSYTCNEMKSLAMNRSYWIEFVRQ